MTELIDPRMLGFNYSSGWGSGPKPPVYHLAMKVAQALSQHATKMGKNAWELEMAIRDVRLATTGAEKSRAVATLEEVLDKYLYPQTMNHD